MLAHHRRQAPLELSKEITESTVAVAIAMDVAILLPEHLEIDAGPLHLARQRRPIRLGTPTNAGDIAGLREQPLFENIVRQIGRQRPREAGLLRPFQIVLHGAARDAELSPDLPRTHTVMKQSQHLPQLSHRQPSLRRHQNPPRQSRGDAWGADLRESCRSGRLEIGMVAGFKSERWPGSNRYGWPD